MMRKALFVVLCWTAASARADITSNLIARWQFDENAGTTTADSSGNGNTGTLTNGAAWAAGRLNSCIEFDGTNDRVSTDLDYTGDNVTIAAWIYPHSFGGNNKGRVIDSGQSLFFVDTGGSVTNGISYIANGASTSQVFNSNTIVLNAWQHVCIVYTSSNSTGLLYINGELVSTNTGIPYGSGATNAQIGGRASANDRNFDGLIDEVRIYSRALSAADVAELYAADSPVRSFRPRAMLIGRLLKETPRWPVLLLR
jgi:hypothetical protein